MKTQISISATLPAPRFQLFDRVEYDSRSGVVVGLYYVTNVIAIADSYDPGWHYVIDYLHGLSALEVARVARSETPLECFAHEDLITRVKELAPTAA